MICDFSLDVVLDGFLRVNPNNHIDIMFFLIKYLLNKFLCFEKKVPCLIIVFIIQCISSFIDFI